MQKYVTEHYGPHAYQDKLQNYSINKKKDVTFKIPFSSSFEKNILFDMNQFINYKIKNLGAVDSMGKIYT